MSRAQRLLDLLQLLRMHRFPVAGSELAAQLGISLRTLYRDIATLQAQGAQIEGEAGLGYVLKPGFTLPPLMFSPEELDALVLGLRWVAERADDDLQSAARQAKAKISAVLPATLRHQLDHSPLLIGPNEIAEGSHDFLAEIRLAIREQTKLAIRYSDSKSQASERIVWPLALGFFDQVRILIAWCELRAQFRCFRTDRIHQLLTAETRYSTPRQQLLQQWREQEGIANS
ncbi:YafY family transcriptional regulator [Chitinibacter sp. SCUT-21]|uniref:helix-turn-helix transcriptional regulator n=1 Tax=Chitinibacter sp. SCUT-21 TaxID=2970891 RepID=UPI0035A573DF